MSRWQRNVLRAVWCANGAQESSPGPSEPQRATP